MKVFLRDIKEKFPEFEIINYDSESFFVGFNHDSRTIKEDEIFIPIIGENFNGHDYILEALNSGASMSICEYQFVSKVSSTNKPIIVVSSIRDGLQKILNLATSPITVPIVAISGSTGKTTTREMLATILSGDGKVLTSDHSNTVWGNAALLSKYTDEKYVVLECAMDSPGEISWHANSVDTDIGVLLNITYVHAQRLGTIEDVYEEKKDLADYLDRNGKPLVLNIDDERLVRIVNNYKSEIITFGKSEKADYRIFDIDVNYTGTNFKISNQGNVTYVHVDGYGEGLAYDATASIAVARRLGLDIESCVNNLLQFKPNEGRFEITKLKDGNLVINDAYNANPLSMEMSVNTFDSLFNANDFVRIIVLGDMKELGNVSAQMHKELGELVKKKNFDYVYYFGEEYESFGQGKRVKNLDELRIDLQRNLSENNSKQKAILLKGSHSLGLSEIVKTLT